LLDIENIRSANYETLCLAHFGEFSSSSGFFERVTATYKAWATAVSEYVTKNAVAQYDLKDSERLAFELEHIYPEYRNLPSSLREQMLRVDIAGMLNYFARLSQSK
jgi:hypothetical protein